MRRLALLLLLLLLPAAVSAQTGQTVKVLKIIPLTFTDHRTQEMTLPYMQGYFGPLIDGWTRQSSYSQYAVDVRVLPYLNLDIATPSCANGPDATAAYISAGKRIGAQQGVYVADGSYYWFVAPSMVNDCHDAKTYFSDTLPLWSWNLGSGFEVIYTCATPGGTATFIDLDPSTGQPRNCAVGGRSFFSAAGQGSGILNVTERIWTLVQMWPGSLVTVPAPSLGAGRHYTLNSVESGVGIQQLDVPDMGVLLEYRSSVQTTGVMGYWRGAGSFLLDMQPGGRSGDALNAGGSVSNPDNHLRVSVITASPTQADVYIDHDGETLPPPPCQVSPNGTLGPHIVDANCNVWEWVNVLYPWGPQIQRNGQEVMRYATEIEWCDQLVYLHTGDGSWAAMTSNPNSTYAWGTPPPTCGLASDTTPPVIGAVTTSDTRTITANVTDNVFVKKVEFYLDGSLRQTVTAAPFTAQIALVNGAPNVITIKACDGSNNCAQVIR